MSSVLTSPWQAAVDRISGKTVVGSRLRSADWAKMPQALRDGALFSSGVEDVRIMSAMREKLSQAAQQVRTGGTLMDRGRFVADMRNMLGAAPGDSGELTDITSVRRLELIWNYQQTEIHAFASRKADLDPDLMDAFPGYRLVRIESRRVPRDWLILWAAAGSAVGWLGASRRSMIALKTSPIWAALSQFGRPWPPFRYGSGMGLDDADRDECEEEGLLPKDEPPAERLQRLRDGAAEHQRNWNDSLAASVKGLDAKALEWLKSAFGDQISIEAESVRWTGGDAPAKSSPAPTAETATPPAAEIPPVSEVTKPVLPDVERVTTAVSKATTREEAHAIVSLPAVERGSLSLNPSPGAVAQTTQAHDFIRTLLHRDVAPLASCKIELHSGRGSYDPDTATVKMRAGDVRGTIHEIAHHIECCDREIFAECREFLKSRTKPGEIPQRLSRLTGSSHHAPHEIAIEDEFAARGGSAYAGRIYPESFGATEILTMGLERMYLEPAKFAREDPEYFKFILRALRPTP